MSKKNHKVRVARYIVGDIVRVRSIGRVSQSLDSFNRLDGCLFMDQMWKFCGNEFRVLKVVNNFFDEHRYKMHRTRAPLYILDGLICDGMVDSFEHRCDRSCYLLWHEEWLEKA